MPDRDMFEATIADARAQLQRDEAELAAASGRVNGAHDALLAEAAQRVAQR